MKIINQTDMRYGEIDQDLLGSTDQPEYMQAIAKGTNCYINSKRKISKRSGFIADKESAIFESGIENGLKQVTYTTADDVTLTAILYVHTTAVNLYLRNWKNGQELNIELYDVAAGSVIDDFSIDASDKFIVVSNVAYPTHEISINVDTLSMSTHKNIDFSVVPSIDDGIVNYSGATFTIETSDNVTLGSVINITNLVAGKPTFDTNWVGGTVISRNGTTVDQPIATAIITKVTFGAGTEVIFNTIVTSPFSDKALISGGQAWSVRKPIWSKPDTIDNRGYPKLCSFHGGRLWLAGTKEYPTMICGSTEATYNDFDTRDGSDAAAIVFLMKEARGGSITHIFGGINLNIWTNRTQYIAWSGLDVGLTPKNFDPKAESDYTISKCNPIRYKDKIYFSTADGKALIELTETYQQVNAIDISFSAKHLINNPIQAEISVLSSENEQLAFFVNEDKSVFCYSKSAALGVTAFTPIEYKFPKNYILLALISVKEQMYQVIYNTVTHKVFFMESMNDFYLDSARKLTFTDGKAPTLDTYTDGEVLEVIQINDGTTYWLGKGKIVGNELVKDIPDGDYFAGFIYTVDIKSVNNIANPQNVFYKTKKYKDAVEFYKSYDLTINGTPAALPNLAQVQSDGVVLQSGFSIRGSAQGTKSFQQITITQNSPYPCNIQGMGYIAQAELRL